MALVDHLVADLSHLQKIVLDLDRRYSGSLDLYDLLYRRRFVEAERNKQPNY